MTLTKLLTGKPGNIDELIECVMEKSVKMCTIIPIKVIFKSRYDNWNKCVKGKTEYRIGDTKIKYVDEEYETIAAEENIRGKHNEMIELLKDEAKPTLSYLKDNDIRILRMYEIKFLSSLVLFVVSSKLPQASQIEP